MTDTTLSRRHFNIIAEIIRDLPTHEESEAMARHFERHLPETNSRFDEHAFRMACTDRDYSYGGGRREFGPNY